MEILFYVVPTIMIVIVSCAAVAVIRRSVRVGRAWNSGLTAEARCLRTYTTTSGGGDSSVRTTLHHVYEFTARDGRGVRFEERGGPGTTLEGDIVTVHYPADRPEQATARPPARGRLVAGTGCVLGFLGVFVLFAVGFMAVTYAMFSTAGEALP
ncbi:DUF3592 domain-containing protein [Streptomyces sp. NPDC006624]|uniref:DUF3592 domain-containing protein n=1 Tax=unclassified Streptomyces TaxID=2593676 RepID=UPI0033BF270A